MFSNIQPVRIGASFRALLKNPFGQVLPLELAGLLAVYGTVPRTMKPGARLPLMLARANWLSAGSEVRVAASERPKVAPLEGSACRRIC